MRPILAAAALAALLLLSSAPAAADDGLRWRRTTPRASLSAAGDALELRVPVGRAWGIASDPIALEPGGVYRARVELEVPAERLRGVFLRVALYQRADGRGRQRERHDSIPLGAGYGARVVEFVAPPWARAAKLRLLVRADADMSAPVRARHAGLAAVERQPPEVILRPDD